MQFFNRLTSPLWPALLRLLLLPLSTFDPVANFSHFEVKTTNNIIAIRHHPLPQKKISETCAKSQSVQGKQMIPKKTHTWRTEGSTTKSWCTNTEEDKEVIYLINEIMFLSSLINKKKSINEFYSHFARIASCYRIIAYISAQHLNAQTAWVFFCIQNIAYFLAQNKQYDFSLV